MTTTRITTLTLTVDPDNPAPATNTDTEYGLREMQGMFHELADRGLHVDLRSVTYPDEETVVVTADGAVVREA